MEVRTICQMSQMKKDVYTHSQNQELKMDSMKHGAVFPSRFSAAFLCKGILKRNPRGCGGICDCIYCASFRLNARGGYEFSRNQMLDFEQLFLDMRKELSNLLFMLENSVNCGNNNHVILPADQVLQACTRAGNMVVTAIRQSGQMQEAVDILGRIKHKSVNIFSYVEEKTIGKSRRLFRNLSSI